MPLPIEPGTVTAIVNLISALAKVIGEAFTQKDPAKLEKVMSALDPSDPAKLAAVIAMENEKAKEHYGED